MSPQAIPLDILPKRRVKIIDKEIHIYANTLFLGYLQPCSNKITQPRMIGKWFPTNDLGYRDRHSLVIIGRKDRQFISGGENIHPEEIERVILSFSPLKIEHALVIPMNHYRWGQVPIAILDTPNKINKTNIKMLLNFLQKHLEKYKIPVSFYTVGKEIKQSFGLKLSKPILEKALINGKLISIYES